MAMRENLKIHSNMALGGAIGNFGNNECGTVTMTTKWYPCDIKFYSKMASGSTTEKVKIIFWGPTPHPRLYLWFVSLLPLPPNLNSCMKTQSMAHICTPLLQGHSTLATNTAKCDYMKPACSRTCFSPCLGILWQR